MKKKILALLATLVMVFTMVGCNDQGVALTKELERVAAWDAFTQKGTMNITVKVDGQNVKLGTDYEAYYNAKDLQMEMTMTFKKLEMSGMTIDLSKDPYKLSPVKTYMDCKNLKFYLSTSYIKDICKLVGVDAATIMDASKEYVALDLSSMMTDKNKEEIMKYRNTDYSVFTNLKVELPITKKDKTFTIELTGDQMVDALFALVNETFTTQKDLLTTTYKQMGLTDEQIKEMFKGVADVYSDANKKVAKTALTGTNAKVSYTFEDAKYVEAVNANFKITIDKEVVEFGITMKDEVKKADVKAVQFPASVKMYTMDDILKASQAVYTTEKIVEANVVEAK